MLGSEGRSPDETVLPVLAHRLFDSMTLVSGAVETVRTHRHQLEEPVVEALLEMAERRAKLLTETLKVLLVNGPADALGVFGEGPFPPGH